MTRIQIGIMVALFLPAPVRLQVTGGSLVVWIVSQRSDYVVIGAESRNTDKHLNVLNDRACKIISLGNDTLFYETGNSEIWVQRGLPWSSRDAARSVYSSSPKHDATSLSAAWATNAVRWFYAQPELDLRGLSEPPHGNLVTGGFINFDKNGFLTIRTEEVSFNADKRQLIAQASTQAPGQVGVSGVGLDLVKEFFIGKTPRAARAFGPIGIVRLIGVYAAGDVENIRKAFRFVLDNASEEEKKFLGGDIDIAIIRNDRTIEWIARKSWCYEQDQETTNLPKQNAFDGPLSTLGVY
jgi:hypothetical protein